MFVFFHPHLCSDRWWWEFLYCIVLVFNVLCLLLLPPLLAVSYSFITIYYCMYFSVHYIFMLLCFIFLYIADVFITFFAASASGFVLLLFYCCTVYMHAHRNTHMLMVLCYGFYCILLILCKAIGHSHWKQKGRAKILNKSCNGHGNGP